MLPLHTQKSLDALTWKEIQKLHSSLGLKATAATRTRRDYQRRIVAAMPQPVVEPEHTVTPLTCAACPLARLIDGNRYCCGLTNNVTRGHWEAQTDCYDAVAQTQAETETTETVAEPEVLIALIEATPQEIAAQPQPAKTEITATTATATTTDDAPPNRGDNGRNRVKAIALIAPAPKSHFSSEPTPARVKVKQPPIWLYVPPSQVFETIVWQTPFKGEVLGKRGYRPFFIKNDCIYVVLESRTNTFCASEFASPNYHHKVIRLRSPAGKTFDAASFKQLANARGCPSPKYQTYWWKDVDGRLCNLGELYQNCDGWWWAWASQGDREGCKFQTQIQAQKYLETAAGKPVTRQGLKNHPFNTFTDDF